MPQEAKYLNRKNQITS